MIMCVSHVGLYASNIKLVKFKFVDLHAMGLNILWCMIEEFHYGMIRTCYSIVHCFPNVLARDPKEKFHV